MTTSDRHKPYGKTSAPQNHPAPEPTPEDIARRYLDLWQDNLKLWATDPAALETWLTENTTKDEPLDKK
ncbi:hypothetical protein [Paremcibacter congregatus]|uniref:hypothetical protein n=1 Tax=Paremcibacter congregatus TaxID=2043170 RepID=UPI0030EB1430|tara:strand:+ start:6720 stop:6926 length:207 start_codon:yes stop_codon:yes gene_type:complete